MWQQLNTGVDDKVVGAASGGNVGTLYGVLRSTEYIQQRKRELELISGHHSLVLSGTCRLKGKGGCVWEDEGGFG